MLTVVLLLLKLDCCFYSTLFFRDQNFPPIILLKNHPGSKLRYKVLFSFSLLVSLSKKTYDFVDFSIAKVTLDFDRIVT